MENKIPTAEEFLASKQYDWAEDINTTECMIEFAKLHCEAQAKIIAKNVKMEDVGEVNSEWDWEEYYIVYKNSILNAYPLDNIK